MMIRASRDQSSFDNSPGLIAVFHALLRLLAPRHPPHALGSLTALILSSDNALEDASGLRRDARQVSPIENRLLLPTHGRSNRCQALACAAGLWSRVGDPNPWALSNVLLMGSCRDSSTILWQSP